MTRRRPRRRLDRARRHPGRPPARADRARVRPAALPPRPPRRRPSRATSCCSEVWGWSFGDQSTVTVHVRRLREKVEADPTHPVRLVDRLGRRLPLGAGDMTHDQVVIILHHRRLVRRRSASSAASCVLAGPPCARSRWLTVGVATAAVAGRRRRHRGDRARDVPVRPRPRRDRARWPSSPASSRCVFALAVGTALVRWSRRLRDEARRLRRERARSSSEPSRTRRVHRAVRRAAPHQRAARRVARPRASRWSSRGASWCRGSPTTCARRWPGCAR